MRVDEVMSGQVGTCRPDDPLDVPARIMRDQGCGCVVVVDDARKPVAVVTDRDICLCALMTFTSLPVLRVSQAMSRNLATCGPGASLAEAEATMCRWHVRRLPVVDSGGKLVGLLSLDDIAWAAARKGNLFASRVTPAEVGQTLAEVAHPRVIVEGGGPSG